MQFCGSWMHIGAKRGQKAGGRGEGRKIGLMNDFCQIEASKSRYRNFFENFSAGLFGGNGSLLYFCTRNRDARLSCSLRYALPQGGGMEGMIANDL